MKFSLSDSVLIEGKPFDVVGILSAEDTGEGYCYVCRPDSDTRSPRHCPSFPESALTVKPTRTAKKPKVESGD